MRILKWLIMVPKRAQVGKDFLEQVDPEIALISLGIENRYGHPMKKYLKDLRRKSRLYSTQDNGAITMKVTDQSIRIQGYVK